MRAADVDALLFGCTHYPFLARVIGDVMGPGVTLVSSADETAFAAHRILGELGLISADAAPGRHTFLSSGDIETFRELGSRLLGPELNHTARWTPPTFGDCAPEPHRSSARERSHDDTAPPTPPEPLPRGS